MKTLSLLLLVPASVFIHGIVLSYLWGWFVVPTTGLPDIGWAMAAGLSMFMHYGIHQSESLDTSDKIIEYAVRRLVMLPALSLGIGWVLFNIARTTP